MNESKFPMALILRTRLVAIIRLDDLSDAMEISAALLAGGIRVQEYTLTNPDALIAIERVLAGIPAFSSGQAALGIGSVRSTKQVQQAIRSGAQFVVTPALNAEVVGSCVAAGIPVACGAYTPTEIATAWELGASIVKVFPARNLGPKYIQDVLAPMPELRLMPTGGVNQNNMEEYLTAGAAALGVGGNLVDQDAIRKREWGRVTKTAQQFTQLAQGSSR